MTRLSFISFFCHPEKDVLPAGVQDGEDIDEINVSFLALYLTFFAWEWWCHV